MADQTKERAEYEKLKATKGTHPDVEEAARQRAIASEADPYAGMKGNRSGGGRDSDGHD